MSKILYVHGTTRPDEAWESLKDIVYGLERDRFEPLVACSKDPAWRDSSDEVETVVVKMPKLRKEKSFPRIPLAVGQLSEVIRSRGISLVHANNVWDAPYALWAAEPLKIPVVVHVRTEIDQEKAKSFSLDKADVTISTSRAAVEVLSGIESLAGRIFYLPNGIDLNQFGPPVSDGEARRRFGVNGEAVVFGAVGPIDRLKGLDLLISAFARVAHGTKHVRLLIVGEAKGKGTSFKEELLKTVDRLQLSERVTFIGHQNDPVPYFAAMDILVVPGRTGGSGRSAVEAMAMAKPVIVSDVGPLPEIVLDGLTGHTFSDGDVESLADRMTELAANEQQRATFGRAGRSLAEGRFDLNIMISRLQSIYGVLLAGTEGQ